MGENAFAFSPTLLGMRIKTLSLDPRITVRKPGAPNPEGECVVYWMQCAQRALDNPALDVALELGNELGNQSLLSLLQFLFIRTLICVTTAFSPREFRTSKRDSPSAMSALSCGRTLITALQSFVNRSARRW